MRSDCGGQKHRHRSAEIAVNTPAGVNDSTQCLFLLFAGCCGEDVSERTREKHAGHPSGNFG